jgi:hypothetical protein
VEDKGNNRQELIRTNLNSFAGRNPTERAL